MQCVQWRYEKIQSLGKEPFEFYLPHLRSLPPFSRLDLSNLKWKHSAVCSTQGPNPGSDTVCQGFHYQELEAFPGSPISWPDENWVGDLRSTWYYTGLFKGLFSLCLSPGVSGDEREWEGGQESEGEGAGKMPLEPVLSDILPFCHILLSPETNSSSLQEVWKPRGEDRWGPTWRLASHYYGCDICNKL